MLPGGQSVADAVVEAHKQKNALAAAAAAGPPPPPSVDEGVPSPQPEYVRCRLSDGRQSYVPKSSHIFVEGIGMVRIADILAASDKKDLDLGKMLAEAVPVPAQASLPASGAGSAYTTMGGEEVDLDLPFTPEFVDNALETAAEAVRDAALSGPEFTDTLVDKAESAIIDQAEDEGVAQRRSFLERRIAQEERANRKLALAEKAVLEHPGIHQPLEVTVGAAKGAGRIAERTKPKEVKVVCNIM